MINNLHNSPGGHGNGGRSVVGHCDPGGHNMQSVSPSMLYWPIEHRTAACDVQPKPAGHNSQFVEFCTEYVLKGHGIGGCVTSGQYDPAGQCEHMMAPLNEYVPSGHWRGMMEDIGQWDPAGHSLHNESGQMCACEQRKQNWTNTP